MNKQNIFILIFSIIVLLIVIAAFVIGIISIYNNIKTIKRINAIEKDTNNKLNILLELLSDGRIEDISIHNKTFTPKEIEEFWFRDRTDIINKPEVNEDYLDTSSWNFIDPHSINGRIAINGYVVDLNSEDHAQ